MSPKTMLRNLSLASLACTAAIALTSQPAKAANTTFECISNPNGEGYATIAISPKGNKTKPLITWNSEFFEGSGWTPERRCREVSERLNDVVAQVGGRFKDVLLKTGRVRGYDVVCWVEDEADRCNSDNLLVTMSEGSDPHEFLERLVNRRAAPFDWGIPAEQGGRAPTIARFGQLVEELLEESVHQPIDPDPFDQVQPDPPLDPDEEI